MIDAAVTPIPVTIITGFLGSGKTTLINALLRDPAFAQTAVLINEFGDVQIDHDLVAEFTDELVMTTTGCLCCTASSDIKQSLFELWQNRKNRKVGPYKRVIVETTGLMDPVPVINSLLAAPGQSMIDNIVSQQFALARVVTLFDIINGPISLDNHPEALKQVGLADAVVLTKTDLAKDPASQRDIENDKQRLSSINPSAPVLDRHSDWERISALLRKDGTYDLRTKGEDALAWIDAERHLADPNHIHHHDHGHDHHHQHHDVNRHNDEITSHAIVLDEPVTKPAFDAFISTLKENAGTDLLRLKALVALTDQPDKPVIVHGVQHVIHPVDTLDHWPSEDRRTKIVFIGRNLDVDALCGVLKAA